MGRRIRYYLIGVFFGCLLLTILPRPFQVNKERAAAEIARVTGEYPKEEVDGFGRKVEILYPAKRIVSLAPSVTEILFLLQVDDRLIANTNYCTYPGRARLKEKIGRMDTPDFERIIALRPDIVLGSVLSPHNLYDRLGKMGLTTLALKHDNLEGVLHDILTVGRILGVKERAEEQVKRMRERRLAILQRMDSLKGEALLKVALLYDLETLASAGRGSWVGDMITSCHAENIAAGVASPWPQLSLEGIVAADPDVILLAKDFKNGEVGSEEEIARLQGHSVWKNITAVKSGKIRVVDENLLSIPGPRMILTLEMIARAIRPAEGGRG